MKSKTTDDLRDVWVRAVPDSSSENNYERSETSSLADSVIEISDTDSDCDEVNMMRATDRACGPIHHCEYTYNFNSLDERIRLEMWQKQLIRKLRMASRVYEHMKNMDQSYAKAIGEQNEKNMAHVFSKLTQFHERILSRNDAKRSSFIMLFTLVEFLNYCDPGIFLEPDIIDKLDLILMSWIYGPTFRSNFKSLPTFLTGYYGAEFLDGYQVNWNNILAAFKRTNFYDHEKINSPGTTTLQVCYTNIIIDCFDLIVKQNVFKLPTILELGQINTHAFLSFLDEFSIPFSGPYKKEMQGDIFTDTKIQYFISSANITDSFINGNVPLYGIFEFKLCCLNMTQLETRNYLKTISEMPKWLIYVPPLFNKSLDFIRNRVNEA